MNECAHDACTCIVTGHKAFDNRFCGSACASSFGAEPVCECAHEDCSGHEERVQGESEAAQFA